MEWRALEERFRIAVSPEPGPFGEDAIEWDYSRYARGLGLTGEPGAHDLPHSGCAVVAVPPARFDAAEQKYRGWAERHGWGLWRIGARPTVAVPDPVVYALGIRAARADSLVFARAAPPVVPAVGRRMRSEGMSFPLTPGERWLIATDRVRRRMRMEVARQGLVLLVDEAEWLTPAGLAVLMYLVDAHRAWRARMLSRPARVYVVLVTSPEHEAGVLRMLERFDLTGHTPVVRERRKDAKGGGGTAPPMLRDVEEEHIFGALAAAPVALAKDDVRSVFGASAIDRCRAMAERGLLRVRMEAGEECFVPDAAVPSGHVSASPRALRAIDACYRRRAKRGHEHLVLARAALALELGDSLRAAALVARMSHVAGALLPYRLFEGVDAALERARPRLRADHAAAWFSLAAHQRAYDHAREIASVVTEHEMRTWKEMLRVVEVVLCCGRTHLDTCLPPDFWPRLKSQSLAGPFMDATCVLGELFWRKRYLSNDEIRQRYEFVCDCFERWDRPRSVWFERLERLVRITTYRAALHLGVPSRILSIARAEDAVPQETLRSFLQRNQLPAYVAAAPMFAESAMGYVCPPRSLDHRDRFLAVTFTATTGQPEDVLIATSTAVDRVGARGVRLLLRGALDELLLLVARRANPRDRHDIGRVLRSSEGGRVVLVGANTFCLENGRNDAPGRDADDDGLAAESRILAGDFAGARDLLSTGLATRSCWPLTVGQLITTHIILSRKALDRRLLASSAELAEQNRALLTPDLCAFLAAFLEGSQAVCSGDFDLAARRFLAAHGAVIGTFEWATNMKSMAVRSSCAARRTARIVESWLSGGHQHNIWTSIRALCSGPDWRRASPSLRARAALCLDHLWWVLEAWSKRVGDEDELLRMSFFLKDAVDAVFRPLGRDFLGLMAEWAPTFYERLRAALCERVGPIDLSVPETRAVRAALRTIEETWKSSHVASIDDRCAGIVINEQGSRAKDAKAAGLTWYDDAIAYSQLRDDAGAITTGTFSRVAYGYVGRSAARPVTTALDFSVTPLENGRFEVHVEAGARPPHARGKARRQEPMASLVGQSAAARKVREAIDKAAKCGYPVLVLGETGAGKDLVARCIHAGSVSRGRTLVVAECAGLAETLLESELFGHEKGAFTGAHAKHDGFFARANGATLLLDEVDSMSARMQASLLRVLETGEYRPVGASSARKSEFRLISAALPRLPQMVETGAFRKDLYYRISTLRIEVPPLREREGDSGEIATAFARTLGFRLTTGALRAIAKYEWPGNVRQLRHAIQAASLHASDGRLGEAAVSEVIAGYRGAAAESGGNGRGLDAVWARAVSALEKKGRFGVWDFAQAAGLSRRSAQRYVAHLVRDGRITRLGAGRTTRYSVRT